MVKICILGITGSIGQSTLNIIRKFPHRFRLVSAQCHSNLPALEKVLENFSLEKVLITDESISLSSLKKKYPATKFIQGSSKENYKAFLFSSPIDRVVNGIVGIAGLVPTLLCLENNLDLAIANKESLVVAGDVLTDLRKESGSLFVPVDSEHNAVFQLLEGKKEKGIAVDSIVLTSSGGPFLHHSLSDLEKVSPAQAVNHPNWSMGPKISVDSATMVNKALEILEAHYLFNLPMEQVKVVVHPQSVVHALISTMDGAHQAYLCPPSMEFPIAHSLFYPDVVDTPIKEVRLTDYPKLEFLEVDEKKFPSIPLAYEVGRAGANAPAVYNGANEAAVDLFLREKIPFLSIVDFIKKALDKIEVKKVECVEDCLEADRQARELVATFI